MLILWSISLRAVCLLLRAVIAGALADKMGLTKALLWTVPFPWLICTIVFSLFYFTYPKDAAKVRELMAERREELLVVHQGE